MKMYAFSVFDGAVNAFLPVFFARSKGEAIRSFTTAVGDDTHQFAKHRTDYSLFQVGEFDDLSGLLSGPVVPERVLSASEVAPVL